MIIDLHNILLILVLKIYILKIYSFMPIRYLTKLEVHGFNEKRM